MRNADIALPVAISSSNTMLITKNPCLTVIIIVFIAYHVVSSARMSAGNGKSIDVIST